MKQYRTMTCTAVIFIFINTAYGDSPLTSTDFHTAYHDSPVVTEASEKGIITKKITRFLLSPETPVALKAACINALSWNINGKNNAVLFQKKLLKKHRIKEVSYEKFTGDELFCLAYLTAMDDYFHPEKAIPILKESLRKYRASNTEPLLSVHLVFALILAQKEMGEDWCRVWKLTEDALNNPEIKNDLREEAKKIIINYMILYKEYCK